MLHSSRSSMAQTQPYLIQAAEVWFVFFIQWDQTCYLQLPYLMCSLDNIDNSH